MLKISLKKCAHCFSSKVLENKTVQGVSIDSRTLSAGNLFFALEGENVDGHLFLKEAAKKKAAAAVVSNHYRGPNFGIPLLYVSDVLESLQVLSKEWMRDFSGKCVGVTGSVGKTTTKQFIATILKQSFSTYSFAGNYNSQIGLPLILLNEVSKKEEVIVLEYGMSLKGEIRKLLHMIAPDIGVVTKVGLAHSMNFSSLSEIVDEKLSLFSSPKTATAVIPYGLRKKVHKYPAEQVTFSFTQRLANYYCQKRKQDLLLSHNQTDFKRMELAQIKETHLVYNIACSVIVARILKMEWDAIAQGLKNLKLPIQRFQRIEKNGIVFINDTYNANELSTKAALANLPLPSKGGRRIAVLGEMKELGKFSQICHQRIFRWALRFVDRVVYIGKEYKSVFDRESKRSKNIVFKNSLNELVSFLKQQMRKGDVVLIKGSRAVRLETILEDFNLFSK